MKYRALGSGGVTVSEIGFGAWGIGGLAYGPTDDALSLRALHGAFERGVTFYDTADLYGNGRSETLIGQAFEGLRSRVVIASKVRLPARDTADDTARHIRESLQASLRRLRTDYLDVYQVHDPELERLNEPAVWDTLRALRTEGVIRAIGVSLRAPEDGLEVVTRFGVDCIQANFNVLDQRILDNGLLALCAQRGVGLIARTPLCFGFLTGEYTPEMRFAAEDHRSRWGQAQRERWAEAHRLFAPLKAAQAQSGAQFALRFCLAYEAMSCAIPGMLTMDHVDDNVAASDLGPLPASQRETIERLYRQHDFFVERVSAWRAESHEQSEVKAA